MWTGLNFPVPTGPFKKIHFQGRSSMACQLFYPICFINISQTSITILQDQVIQSWSTLEWTNIIWNHMQSGHPSRQAQMCLLGELQNWRGLVWPFFRPLDFVVFKGCSACARVWSELQLTTMTTWELVADSYKKIFTLSLSLSLTIIGLITIH